MACKGWSLMRMKRYAEAERVLWKADLDDALVRKGLSLVFTLERELPNMIGNLV